MRNFVQFCTCLHFFSRGSLGLPPRRKGRSLAMRSPMAVVTSLITLPLLFTVISAAKLRRTILPPQHSLPPHLRPAKPEIFVIRAGGSENPELRPSCHKLIEHYENFEKTNKDLKSMAHLVATIRSLMIPEDKLAAALPPKVSLDKGIQKMFDVAELNAQASVPDNMMRSLLNCSVDDMGRNIIMMFILRGYRGLFLHSLARNYSGDVALEKLRDMKGNNIVHLAVLSGDSSVVTAVYHRFGDRSLQKALLDARNLDGHRPVDLASTMGHGDITQILKDLYLASSMITRTNLVSRMAKGDITQVLKDLYSSPPSTDNVQPQPEVPASAAPPGDKSPSTSLPSSVAAPPNEQQPTPIKEHA